MRHSIRRQLRFMHAYAATTLIIAAAAASAFVQPARPQNLGEITAERINIVDTDGTLRLVISNKDRMHPGVIGGKVLQRPRPYAGFLFFNDQGDEAGGMTLTGREAEGRRDADAGVMFDQLGQDQTIGFEYTERNGQRSAAFKVWDRPDAPLADLVDELNRARAIQEPAARDAAVARVRAAAPKAAQRVFVGKTTDRGASVLLADAQGRNRLVLKVDADGRASIEFLDADGNVVQRVGPNAPR
jgi:catechol 2,3-dioxygenase-like lactoylglutathione lyase family enzyme